MLPFTRRGAAGALAALVLTACGGTSPNGQDTDQPASESSEKVVLQDIVFGDPNAPVTLVEYASWTCPACLQFHIRIMPTVKADYIDTGKVKLVFREFPTPPANVSVAGFALARCVEDDEYYDTLDELFMRQDAILTLARQGGPVKEALKQIAANHGIEGDEAFQACLDDKGNQDAIRASIASGRNKDVDSTPTFFLNDQEVDQSVWISATTFSAALDEALAAVAPDTDTPDAEASGAEAIATAEPSAEAPDTEANE